MADIKNFGIKGIASDVQMGKSGGRLKYDAGNNRFDLTQSDGATLEDIRFGSVTSGAWTATAIGAQYGGTGQDFSSATGLVSFSSGTASAGNISLSDADLIDSTSQLPVAQGGTGAANASDARDNLGLGNIATQASNSINIDGGSIDGTIIGGTSAAAITGTTITANSGFVGDLTGTAANATVLETARFFSASGDATASGVSFNGSANVDLSLTLADTAVSAGNYGSTTEIPVITVDSKGRLTAASTASIATSFDIAGDNGSNDTVNGGETLSIVGTAGQTETTITNNQVAVGIVDGASIANLSVTGTFTSDDITSAAINIDGDATITGNLTVQGTQTIVNSTTTEVADATFRVNSDGTSVSAGLEANIAGTIESVLYNPVNSRWELSGPVQTSDGFVGNLTGSVTGTVSDISNHSTSDLSEGTNLYWTTARGNAAMDAYLVGGTGLTYTSGTFDLDDTAVTPGTYGNATAIPTFTVDQQGRLTAAGTVDVATSFTFTGDSGSDTVNGGESVAFVGGTNITTTMSNNSLSVALDDDITLSGNVDAVNVTGSGVVEGGTLTDGTLSINSGEITSGVSASFSGSVSGGTLTDGTLSINSGSITSGVAATFSGAVEGGSLTDGTATLSSGALSGATTGGFSGQVTAGSFTDSTATLSGGDLTGAGNVTASGTVQFGSLSDGTISITGFVDEDNMASDSDTLVPTQQSVKAYVDAQITAEDLDFAGDSGTGAIDLDSQSLTIAGGTGLTSSASGQTLTIDLDDTAVSAGNYGGTTAVPVLTIDAQGRITSASNAAIATSFDIAGDSGSNDTVNGGETLSIVGTAGQLSSTITNNQVQFGIVDGASIANLTVTGTFTSDDITSSAISIDGDATITGNLTVQGTQTVVNSTTVETADAIFRVNSNGANTDAGFEANANGVIKQILYTSAGQEWDFGSENVKASTFEGDLTGDVTGNVTGTVSSIANHSTTDLSEGTNLYWTTARGNSTIAAYTGGMTNMTGAVTTTGDVSGANVTASGDLAFGSLTDSGESITVTKFVDEADGIANNDNDTTIPTTAAVIDYVENNGGDGLLLRNTFTANSSDSDFDIGTMPNVSSRTYYAEKIVIKVGTAFSGGSFNHILVKENGGSGDTIVASVDADAGTQGTYIIELDGDQTLTKNASVQVQFKQADGTSAAVVTAGVMTATVHYNWV
jgi:hypothetical protein